MVAVTRTVSPEKSTMVIRPLELGPGLETATAYLTGCPAGPITPIVASTGRYVLPHPVTAMKLAAIAAAARPRVHRWLPLCLTLPSNCIRSERKTSPTMRQMLAMLKA